MKMKLHTLRKSRKILIHANSLYRHGWHKLSRADLARVEQLLKKLDQALMDRDRASADQLAREVEAYVPTILQKPKWRTCLEVGGAILFALIVAIVVRQSWFELYEIPSGSMRPTLREEDRALVSKTPFGLNVPLAANQFYFDPELVKRTGIFIFRPEGIDLADSNHLYFYLFPGKKRYIKRCMGKPGDTLYFYGGKIYGIDREGNDLIELRENPDLEKLEHIPFISFEGNPTLSPMNEKEIHASVYLRQMDQPLARLMLMKNREIRGNIQVNGEWQVDQGPLSNSDKISSYSDFWGFRNFAMARLLTPQEAITLNELPTDLVGKGALYLELRHTANLHWPKPILSRDNQGRPCPMLKPSVTFIPLQKEHLDRIMGQLYTSRFQVEDGYAYLSSFAKHKGKRNIAVRFPDVPNGEYEFYNGVGYSVGFGGILKELPPDHPLNSTRVENIQRLYNFGIEMINYYQYPSRYAYFRDGDLYLMGAPILFKGEPTLSAFLEREKRLAANALSQSPYIPFVDHGPPMRNGEIDADFIRTFGVTVPDKMYLALGDNHASSNDSRSFGFVPQENLRGAPIMILWPPGSRWGWFPYPENHWFNLPRAIVYTIVLVIGIGYWIYRRRRNRGPIFHKLSP